MTDQAREARRAYKREWNRKNKDRVAEHQRRYWERRAAAASQTDGQEAQDHDSRVAISRSGERADG